MADRRRLATAWGLPIATMLLVIPAGATIKTWVWTTALVWMGAACLLNARRCGRRHCFLTGSFFLLMAGAVVLHGLEVVALGRNGWTWLAITLVAGNWMLWYVPERIWGPYARAAPTETRSRRSTREGDGAPCSPPDCSCR